ncbi:hypothetical protein JW826_02950 [Candidatus Woesearchaeota archaeon]|nr:hypothetical protein [Candidatus Woesearchaeota archaeon]
MMRFNFRRFLMIFLGILFALAGLVSAYTYYGHYSHYYGSGYRPFNGYYNYGPAIYYGPHYNYGWYAPSYTYYRYYPTYTQYYRPVYTPTYRYYPSQRYWWAW